MNMQRNLSKWPILAAVCFLAAASTHLARGQANALPAEILEPVVIQDYGFEKSLLSFATERLKLLGRGADLPDQHPILTLLNSFLTEGGSARL